MDAAPQTVTEGGREAPDERPAAPALAAEPERLTPLMAQYPEIKAANPGSLLSCRMGDFFEMFFDDAAKASRALGIALTRHGRVSLWPSKT